MADVQSAHLNVQERRGFMVVQMPVPYPFIPRLKQLEGESAVSRGLQEVLFPFATKVTVSPVNVDETVHSGRSTRRMGRPGALDGSGGRLDPARAAARPGRG